MRSINKITRTSKTVPHACRVVCRTLHALSLCEDNPILDYVHYINYVHYVNFVQYVDYVHYANYVPYLNMSGDEFMSISSN